MERSACVRGVSIPEVSGDSIGTGINECLGLKFNPIVADPSTTGPGFAVTEFCPR